MTIAKEKKALTVKQYEFYKNALKPMSDTAISKIHGMTMNELNAWKKENDLIGKYNVHKIVAEQKKGTAVSTVEEKPKGCLDKAVVETMPAAKEIIKETTTKLLKENDIPPERIKQQSPIIENTANIAYASDSTVGLDKEVKKTLEALKTSSEWIYAENILPMNENNIYLTADTLNERETRLAWLEERHTADTDMIDNLHAKCATLERKLANQSERYSVDVQNLNYEIEKLNAALTIHAKDEQLVFLLAGKVASVGNRLIEPLEDGRH